MPVLKRIVKQLAKYLIKMFSRYSIRELTYTTFFIAFLFLYIYFRRDLPQSGGKIIISACIISIIVSLILSYPHRNNPNYTIYYLVDPRRLSTLSKLILFLSIFVYIFLFFFAQCNAYGKFLSVECIGGIMDGSLKKSIIEHIR